MLIGRLAMKLAGNQPISMAKKPLNRPRAASENATGKPISMITISPANMIGAKFSMCMGRVFLEKSGRSALFVDAFTAPASRNGC